MGLPYLDINVYALNQCLFSPISQATSTSSLVSLAIFLSYTTITTLASAYYLPTTGIKAFCSEIRIAIPLTLQVREEYSSYSLESEGYDQKYLKDLPQHQRKKKDLVRSAVICLFSRIHLHIKSKLRHKNCFIYCAAVPCLTHYQSVVL